MPMCDEDLSSQYCQIIGILRWVIELGQIDILTEVAMLSQYQASPRQGHLEALYWIVNICCTSMHRLILNHP
jgi:hypothetical protein